VSVTVSLVPRVRAAIATIGEDAWTPIAYREGGCQVFCVNGC
jgi:hypothetical protein